MAAVKVRDYLGCLATEKVSAAARVAYGWLRRLMMARCGLRGHFFRSAFEFSHYIGVFVQIVEVPEAAYVNRCVVVTKKDVSVVVR